MNTSTALALAAVTVAMGACNPADPNRTTSAPPGVANPTAIVEPITTPSAGPAPAERGPIPPNANAQAPGTNASLAFADWQGSGTKPPSSKGGPPEAQAAYVKTQEAVDKAPDTAAGDAAKESARSAPGETAKGSTTTTARDTSANQPHGTLSAQEESTQMPKAGQANNHSSPALDKGNGQPSDGSAPQK